MEKNHENEWFSTNHSQITTKICSIANIALQDFKNTKPSYLTFRLFFSLWDFNVLYLKMAPCNLFRVLWEQATLYAWWQVNPLKARANMNTYLIRFIHHIINTAISNNWQLISNIKFVCVPFFSGAPNIHDNCILSHYSCLCHHICISWRICGTWNGEYIYLNLKNDYDIDVKRSLLSKVLWKGIVLSFNQNIIQNYNLAPIG